jgi:hypothetical protein
MKSSRKLSVVHWESESTVHKCDFARPDPDLYEDIPSDGNSQAAFAKGKPESEKLGAYPNFPRINGV